MVNKDPSLRSGWQKRKFLHYSPKYSIRAWFLALIAYALARLVP